MANNTAHNNNGAARGCRKDGSQIMAETTVTLTSNVNQDSASAERTERAVIWTKAMFISKYGPTCSPSQARVLVPSFTEKGIRDQCVTGMFRAVKVGRRWVINSAALCDALGIE